MKIPPYIAVKLKTMTIEKLLGLLFEHIESGELFWFKVNDFEIELKTNEEEFFTIDLNQELLKQYNKIFGYESW